MARLRLLLPLLALMMLMVGAAQAQKDDAADDTVDIGVRAVLADGDSGTDVFENGATAYLYAFMGSEGDSVTISMNATEDSTLDPFLALLGPSGELIASNDDTEDGLDALIDGAELPESGTYLILATSYIYITNVLVETGSEDVDQSENAAFDLALSGNTEPTDLAPEDALIDLTILEVGGTVDGEYTPENPVGYFVLNASAGDVISLSAESDDIDTIIHVFSPFGSRVAVNDDGGDGTNSQIDDLELTDDGTYLIFVTDVFFYNADDTAEAGTYSITAE
jgi:hypothetical protein